MLKLKEKEHAEKGYPFDGEFYIWDYRYYDQKFIQSSLDLDESLVKEYFPVSVIVPQILQIYQNLLSIKFVEMKTETWHEGDLPTKRSTNKTETVSQMCRSIRSGRRTPRPRTTLLDIVTSIYSQGVSNDLGRDLDCRSDLTAPQLRSTRTPLFGV